ncbi:MAG: hypothetical protein ABR583_07300 [Gaiellaceae bacterium]
MRNTTARLALTAAGALAALAALAGAQTALGSGSGVPAHVMHQARCVDTGYWGRYISSVPGLLETQPGVGTTIVDGTGYSPPATHQYIYFRIWAYEYSTGRWLASSYKRRQNGVIGETEEYNPASGSWMAPNGYITDSANLNIGIHEVAVRAGTGWYYVLTEIYWNRPSADWSDNAGSQPGGLRHYDAHGYCRFGATAAKAGKRKPRPPHVGPSLRRR